MSKYDSDDFSDFFNTNSSNNNAYNSDYNDDAIQTNDFMFNNHMEDEYGYDDEEDDYGYEDSSDSHDPYSASRTRNDYDNRRRNNGAREDSSENPGRSNFNSEEAGIRMKLRKSKKQGIIITLIQLLVSVAFMGILYFAKENLSSIITMPVYIIIGAVLFLLFLMTFNMQMKRLLVKRVGKVISVIITIILLVGSYFLYPLAGISFGGTAKVSMEPFVLYLSGTDSFDEISKTSNGRTDTNIIAVVNPKTHTAVLISTPRDAYVELIADDIPSGNYDKLTHAGIYGTGVLDKNNKWGHGCDVSMNILGNLYDVDIEHYLRLNFTGFADLVDNLGGVTIDIPQGFSTYTYGKSYTFEEGTHTLNGDEALTYVRERKSFATGDMQRGENQVAVIKALVDQAISANMVKNYSSIVKNISKSFETDLDISSLAALQLKLQTQKDFNGWNIVSYSVTGSTGGGYQYCYTTDSYLSVVMLNDDSVEVAKTLISKVLNGDEVTDDTVKELEE